MARLTAEQWEQARAEYEVRGVSLGEVAKQFGVTRQAVSKQAQKDGWIQGKSCGVVEKKVNAIKALHEAECESCHLPATFQHTIDDVVRERLEADHMLAQFDRALSVRGLAILQSVATAEEWETMTRGRRNMAPSREAQPQTTVNVTQQQAQAMPPPSPQSATTSPYLACSVSMGVPESAPWLSPYMGELSAFSPTGTHLHDDQVDVTVDALSEFLNSTRGMSRGMDLS